MTCLAKVNNNYQKNISLKSVVGRRSTRICITARILVRVKKRRKNVMVGENSAEILEATIDEQNFVSYSSQNGVLAEGTKCGDEIERIS